MQRQTRSFASAAGRLEPSRFELGLLVFRTKVYRWMAPLTHARVDIPTLDAAASIVGHVIFSILTALLGALILCLDFLNPAPWALCFSGRRR